MIVASGKVYSDAELSVGSPRISSYCSRSAAGDAAVESMVVIGRTDKDGKEELSDSHGALRITAEEEKLFFSPPPCEAHSPDLPRDKFTHPADVQRLPPP